VLAAEEVFFAGMAAVFCPVGAGACDCAGGVHPGGAIKPAPDGVFAEFAVARAAAGFAGVCEFVPAFVVLEAALR
jgi:hypothetical protein